MTTLEAYRDYLLLLKTSPERQGLNSTCCLHGSWGQEPGVSWAVRRLMGCQPGRKPEARPLSSARVGFSTGQLIPRWLAPLRARGKKEGEERSQRLLEPSLGCARSSPPNSMGHTEASPCSVGGASTASPAHPMETPWGLAVIVCPVGPTIPVSRHRKFTPPSQVP